MGCAYSLPALAEDLKKCENPLIERCVAEVATEMCLQKWGAFTHDLTDKLDKTGPGGKLKPAAPLVLKVGKVDRVPLFYMHAAPYSYYKFARKGAVRGPTALVGEDGVTVLGAIRSCQAAPLHFKDSRSMVAYSTTPLFEGQLAETVNFREAMILYPHFANGNEHSMYPWFKLTAPPYSDTLGHVHFATADGFEKERAYGLVFPPNKKSMGDLFPFFVKDRAGHTVAKSSGKAETSSHYNMSVARGMDLSLVAVIHFMWQLIIDETIKIRGA